MGESFEILFWLAVFVFFALRAAAQNRAKSRSSRPEPRDDGEAAAGRRGIFADLMQQIEAQMEAQRREAGARGAAGDEEPPEPVRLTPAAERRRRRVETVEARAHPAERRPAAPHAPERWSPAGVSGPEWRTASGHPAGEPWRGTAGAEEDRDPERRHLPAEPGREPERTYGVPGRRVQAPGTVSVGRSPETASALRGSAATTPIGGTGASEDLRIERVARRGAAAGGLGRFDRYTPLRRAIILSEVLDAPPGLTGRTPLDRRREEIG